MDPFTGGCLCGDVRIVASGRPYAGRALPAVSTAASIMAALFHASAIFPQDAVTIEGETRDYQGRFFCPRCGSSVSGRSADEIEVNLGSLDAPDQLVPTYELLDGPPRSLAAALSAQPAFTRATARDHGPLRGLIRAPAPSVRRPVSSSGRSRARRR